MSKPVPENALIVVADGGKAILFRNAGHGSELSLKEEQRLTHKDFVNDGPSGARPGDQTLHQTEEATFAKHLAQTLFTMHEKKAYQAMVLIADPQTLGQLRDAMHKTVAGTIVQTMSKDYTNNTIKEIEKALSH